MDPNLHAPQQAHHQHGDWPRFLQSPFPLEVRRWPRKRWLHYGNTRGSPQMAIHGYGSTAMGDQQPFLESFQYLYCIQPLGSFNQVEWNGLFGSRFQGRGGKKKKQHMSTPFGVFFFGEEARIDRVASSWFFSPNSFSYRCSYFLGGEGSQNLWIRCEGGCHTGSRWRCRLVCVGVRVRRSKTGLSSHRVSLEV